MKPFCVECGKEMRLEKMGATVIVPFQKPPHPYQAWAGDLYKCPSCEKQIVTGYADRPYWQHFEDQPAPEGEYVYRMRFDK